MQSTIQNLFSFIHDSPTSYHAVDTMGSVLQSEGYVRLEESTPWKLVPGGKYFVTRNLSSLIAFRIPAEPAASFHIAASHGDSPSFKIKELPELPSAGLYVRLNVEKYGGMLMGPWMDRPLSVAGRILVEKDGQLRTKLVNVDRDLLLIPSLAIHMNREANNGFKPDPQKDMLPLYGDISRRDTFLRCVAEAAGEDPEHIAGHDLFLYCRMPGTLWGAGEEYISSPRLDDLQCAFSSLTAFVHTGKDSSQGDIPGPSSIPVHCVLDNEEVGSVTKQGAASTFLKDTLQRICLCLGKSREDYLTMLASSFMLSADNAHAVHPNQPEKADAVNRPSINKGIVIKYNGNQRYTTDAVSAAVFKTICRRAQVPFQTFLNRSDMAGGSTLGNISASQVPVNTVDIGLPQLAMHSPFETAGAADTDYMIRAMEEFFRCRIHCKGDGSYDIK